MQAELDTNTYQRGIRILAEEITALEDTGILARHTFHGDWNYTMNPCDTPKEPT